ncbi:uncharacterized protein LOC144144935 [Haemaphysalis longicornis]
MASPCRLFVTLVVFGAFNYVHSSRPFPENNPQLGIYQDEADCFPLQDTWVLIYRSFEQDPYFGGSPTCIEFSESGPFENGSGPVTGEIGGNTTVEAIATLMSSPGYVVKNVLNLRTVEAPEVNVNLTAVYRDCGSCKVMRHSYIDGGKGCGLWQPKSAIGEDVTCCEFIYDLVCGTGPKYQVYEKCE